MEPELLVHLPLDLTWWWRLCWHIPPRPRMGKGWAFGADTKREEGPHQQFHFLISSLPTEIT